MISHENKILLDDLTNHVTRLALEQVDDNGIPFAGLVVDSQGSILGEGVNRVARENDPTAHAEIVAIRNACQNLKVNNLVGKTLIASGEPCAMCYITAYCLGIRQVIFTVDRVEAARSGFDYRQGYKALKQGVDALPLVILKHERPNAMQPFSNWQEKHTCMS